MTNADHASTLIPTQLLQDNRLSFEAVGLYCFIASRNFQVDIRDLARSYFTAPYVAAALEELKAFGYLQVGEDSAAGGLT